MKSVAHTVTTTATLVCDSDDLTRVVYLHSGTGSVYIGGSTVTSSTGIHLPNGTTIAITLPARQTIYAITNAASQTMITMTPDTD